jgi:ferrous iron transport protein B
VYTLLISAFFAEKYIAGIFSLRGLILFSLYGVGVVGAALVALILSKFVLRGEPSVFVMEMPLLRVPSLKAALISAYDRISVFLRTTGPVIMTSSILLWALASFPKGRIEDTFAGIIGRAIEPLFAPLGFSWEVCIAIVCSFAAREVFVSALGTILNVSSGGADVEAQTIASLIQDKEVLSFPAGMAALIFFVFACQCASTLAVRRETASWRWPVFQFIYMMVLAWVGGWIAYRISGGV